MKFDEGFIIGFRILFPGMKYKTKGGLLSALKPGLPHTITEKSNKAQEIYETLVTLGDIEEQRVV